MQSKSLHGNITHFLFLVLAMCCFCLSYAADTIYVNKAPYFVLDSNNLTKIHSLQQYTFTERLIFDAKDEKLIKNARFSGAFTDFDRDKKITLHYELNKRNPIITLRKQQLFWGKYIGSDENQFATIDFSENSCKVQFAIDSLTITVQTNQPPSTWLLFVIFEVAQDFNIEAKLREKTQITSTIQLPEDAIGGLYDRQRQVFWIWDGNTLKIHNNYNINFEWTFDGYTIKPKYNHNIYKEFEWDGSLFRPTWNYSSEAEWVWEDNELKPNWGAEERFTMILENNVLQPLYYQSGPVSELEIYGDFPKALITLIHLRYVYR